MEILDNKYQRVRPAGIFRKISRVRDLGKMMKWNSQSSVGRHGNGFDKVTKCHLSMEWAITRFSVPQYQSRFSSRQPTTLESQDICPRLSANSPFSALLTQLTKAPPSQGPSPFSLPLLEYLFQPYNEISYSVMYSSVAYMVHGKKVKNRSKNWQKQKSEMKQGQGKHLNSTYLS